MKRVIQVLLASMCICTTVLPTRAQQGPQPVIRLGNWIEVGNDVFLHIIATGDIRYRTVHNFDFENKVRDRTPSRNPHDNPTQETDADISWALLRLGMDFKYQKNLALQLVSEQRTIFDGNLIDDRANTSNPGGTDVFGRAAATENTGYHFKFAWLDYKFQGTPVRLRVGADPWILDQAGTVSDNDPRLAVYGEFGDVDVMAAAVIQFESQRLGLQNDNDLIYYTFSAGYNLKPHRLQFNVVYYRDRFAGADTQLATTLGALGFRSGLGYIGQQTDSVLLMPSWSGQIGPIRALLQGNLLVGTTRGTTVTGGLPSVHGRPLPVGRHYDIFAAGVIAYAEADFGPVRPFVGLFWGSADGDPTDNKLHGFAASPIQDTAGVLGTAWFAFLETSTNFALRDYACPARAQGLPSTLTSLNIGTAVLGGNANNGFGQCAHSGNNVWNDRLGNLSHPGISITYANPGTFVIPVGLKVFPRQGHEITGRYVYRGMVDTTLLRFAFATPDIGKAQVHEIGGHWLWTLNANFDIRLSGNVGFTGTGYRDLARLADCNPTVPGVQACRGNDVALSAEARLRARF